MRHSLIILLLFCLPQGRTERLLDIPHDSFRVDNLGRLQVVSNGNLDLYDPAGKLLGHHSEELLADISTLDRNSSLQMLVFYADVPAFQILDNTLTPHSPVFDLNQEGMSNIVAVCMSANNTFWGYDGVTFELLRFDDNYRVISNSGSTVLTAGQVIYPLRMLEYDGRIYIADADEGIYVFDQFGTYERLIPYPELVDMDIDDGMLYLSNGAGLARVDLLSGSDRYEELSTGPISSLDIATGHVYLGDGEQVRVLPLDSLFE